MDLEWSSGCGVQILARKKDCNLATTEVEADLGEESLKRALFQKTSTLSNTQTAWNAIGSWGETRTWQFICHGMTSMTLWYPPWRILLHWSSSGSLYLYHLALCGVTQKPARVDRWTQAKCVFANFPRWNPGFYPSFSIHTSKIPWFWKTFYMWGCKKTFLTFAILFLGWSFLIPFVSEGFALHDEWKRAR